VNLQVISALINTRLILNGLFGQFIDELLSTRYLLEQTVCRTTSEQVSGELFSFCTGILSPISPVG